MNKWISRSWEMPAIKTDPPAERHLKMIFSPEVNAYDKATVLFSYIPPMGTSGRHSHEDCDEIMYFTGRGLFSLGEEEVEIENDLVSVAHKGVPHEAVNTSETETLKVFCVYLPPLNPAKIHQEAIRLAKEKLGNK